MANKKEYMETLKPFFLQHPTTQALQGLEHGPALCCPSRASLRTPDCHCAANRTLPAPAALSLFRPLYKPVPLNSLYFPHAFCTVPSPSTTWITDSYLNFRPQHPPWGLAGLPEAGLAPSSGLLQHSLAGLSWRFSYFSPSIVSREQDLCFIYLHILCFTLNG